MILKDLKYIVNAFLILASVNIMAQDVVLDTSFGTNGIAKTDINNLYDVFSAFTLQDDGKMIVVGHTSSGSTANKESIIVRYNANGSLDTAFGANGIIVAGYSTLYDTLNAVEVQEDGRILVAGYAESDFLLVRYTASGQLDSSFGTNGVVLTNYYTSLGSNSQDRLNCIAVQNDGKILVGGYAKYFSSYPYALARYNQDGTLDSSFGIGGKTLVGHNFNLASGSKEIFDIMITPLGKIYAFGKAQQSHNSEYTDQTVLRFNSDGTLDQSFGYQGARYFATNKDSSFKEVKVQADGKFVVIGNKGVAMSIARMTDNAILDPTFASGGTHTPGFPTLGGMASFAGSVSIQPDGKILFSGNLNGSAGAQSVIVRYLPNGEYDTSFSDDGIFNFFVGDGYQGGSYSFLQSDGMLVVGGDFNDSNTNTTDLYLFRIGTSTLSAANFSDTGFITYPNPVKDKLYIQTPAHDYDRSYKLFSITGQEMKIDAVRLASEDLLEIDISHLTKGIYILTSSKNTARKIIKE